MRFLPLLLLAVSLTASAADIRPTLPMEACSAHLPYGQPKISKSDVTPVCREGYALVHDNKAKIPVWVAYTLSPTSATGCDDRAAGFKPEPSVPAGKRAETKDYAKSGYDIGHMANSADMRSTDQLSLESNVLSNAAPQLPGLNRAAWKSLEVRSRAWAAGRGDNILIYVGPIYDLKGATTIGKNSVVVPRAFYKVLVDQKTLDVLAFIYPHAASKALPQTFKTSIAEVQKQTGIVLPLPKGAKLGGAVWPTMAQAAKVCAIK